MNRLVATNRVLARMRRRRGAADPTLVMVTIAVLIALTLAGIYFGKGFVEQARDATAQDDLVRVANSQEFYASEKSEYSDSLSELQDGRISFTISDGVEIRILATANSWIASAHHVQSGNTFYRSSGAASITKVGPGNEFTSVTAPNFPAPKVATADASVLTWTALNNAPAQTQE